jgi:hypothetical protein
MKHKMKPGRESATTRQSQELSVPYYFSDVARQRQQNIEIGDYVRVSGLQNKYELMDIIWKYGSVRVRQVGHIESMTMPWNAVTPWKKEVIRSKTALRAVGNWLFRGSEVYLLSEPDRTLRTVKINWDAQTTDLRDEDGQVFHDVPWDDLEFWNPEDYHLADEQGTLG